MLKNKIRMLFSKKLTYDEAVRFVLVAIPVTLLVAGLVVQGISALTKMVIGA